MKKYTYYLIVTLFLQLFSCKDKDYPFLHSKDGFPQTPVNLYFLNSEYDDYNSSMPPCEWNLYPLVFSTNRNSGGNDFDFKHYSLTIMYGYEEKWASVGIGAGGGTYYSLDSIISLANTKNSEYGPYITRYSLHYNPYEEYFEYLFCFTREIQGQFDLKFMTRELDSLIADERYANMWNRYYGIHGEYDIAALNTKEHNEGYLSIWDNSLYYCSDSEGDFNIYELEIDTTIGIVDFLTQNKNLQSSARKIVSSPNDDKCPFVSDNYMVFTSNRDGGQGGFDLWYSKKVNAEWSDPVNFGSSINTVADEYRPIFVVSDSIPNDLMIFSSNREGGLGGFDLYYVGINVAE